MKILLIGASGLLGKAISRKLKQNNHDIKEISARVNIDDGPYDLRYFDTVAFNPQLVINCAAYTNVDLAETETQEATFANTLLPMYLTQEFDCPIIHFSTDYVFSGNSMFDPIKYTEFNIPNPQSVYGKTKLAGDILIGLKKEHYIFRISWLFGHDKKGFMHKAIEGGEYPDLWDKTEGTITYAEDVADVVNFFIDNKPEYGLYNICNTSLPIKKTQVLEHARMTYKALGNKETTLTPKEIETQAPRPRNSALDNRKLCAIYQMPDWKNAVERFVNEEVNRNKI